MKNPKIFIIFFIVFFFGLGSGFSVLNEKLSGNNLEINKIKEKVFLVFDESLLSLRDFGLKIQSNDIYDEAIQNETDVDRFTAFAKTGVNNLALAVYETASPVEQFAIVWYRTISGFFSSAEKTDDSLQFTVDSTNEDETDPSVIANDSEAIQEDDKANSQQPTASSTNQNTTVVTNPIREVIKETVVERVIQTSGITLEDLQKLNNELRSEIYKLSSNTNAQITNTYQVISATNNIDNLGSVTITNSNISSSNVSGTELSFTNGTIQNLTVTGTATSTYSGPISATDGTYSGNLTVTGNTTLNTLTVSGDTIFDTDTLTIDSTNNRIGIGTSTPTDTLSINGPTYLAPISAPAVTTDRLYNISNDLYWAGNLVAGSAVGNWTSNGTDVWRASGNVGIGTTSPYAKLSIAGETVADNFTATSTTATSTFAGGLAVGTNKFVVGYSTNRVGINTSNPNYTLEINGTASTTTLYLPDTGTNQAGIIYKNGTRFIHNFNYGDNGTVTTAGYNTFVGEEAGNLTMGSTATVTGHASYNTAIGSRSLYSNTTGYQNTANGYYSLYSNTDGFQNVASGADALRFNTTGDYNTSNGYGSLRSNTTGDTNTAVGNNALFANTTGSSNIAIGYRSLFENTIGSNNIAFGNNAGRYQSDGVTALTDPENSVYLGYGTRGFSNADSNSIVIGYNAIGIGANSVVLGNDSITTTALKGNVGIGTTSPGVNLHLANGGANLVLLEGDISGGAIDDVGIRYKARGIDYWFAGLGSATSGYSGDFRIANGTDADTNVKFVIRNSTGDVGIGTTSPFAKLSVTGTGTGTGSAFQVADSANSPKFTVLDNGNVGIGTVSPGAKLEIAHEDAGTNDIYELARLTRTTSGTAANGFGSQIISYLEGADGISFDAGALQFAGENIIGNNKGAYFAVQVSNVTGVLQRILYANSGGVGIGTTPYTGAELQVNGDIYFGTSNNAQLKSDGSSFTFNTAGTDKVKITSAGNVGIGTVSPGAKLTVSDGDIVLRTDANDVDAVKLWAGSSLGVVSVYGGGNESIRFNAGGDSWINSSPGNVGIGTTSPFAKLSVTGTGTGTGSAFQVADSANSPKFTVLDNGNVGVGTASPGAKLDVNGSLLVQNNALASADKSGFVFEPIVDLSNPATSALQIYPKDSTYHRLYWGKSDRKIYTMDFSNVFAGLVGVPDITMSGSNINMASGPTISGSAGNPFKVHSYFGLQIEDESNNQIARFGVTNGNPTSYFYGNVGIGTTSPFAKLSIHANNGETNTTLFNIASSTASATTSLFAVLNNGNVGVGTASPTKKLSVVGDASFSLGFTANLTSSITNTLINSSGTNKLGLGVYQYHDHSDSATDVGYAGNFTFTKRQSANISVSRILNLSYANGATSAGTMSNANGISNAFSIAEGSTVVFPDYRGMDITATKGTTGTVTSISGLRVNDISIGASNYGVYLDLPSKVNTWNIYANGTANNYFAGNVGIGTTTPWRTLSVNGTAAFTGLTNDGTGYYACISTSGELATSTTACGASSERFKTNINDLTYGLDTVLQLRPVSFNWKSDFINSSSTQIGFIAEEVNTLIPEVIGHDDKGNIMNLDYPKLTSVLVSAVKELNLKIESIASTTSHLIADSSQPTAVVDSVLNYFDSLGAKFVDGIAYLKTVFVENLTIGSADKPTGMTLYNPNGEPYCITVGLSGELISEPGVCTTANTQQPTADSTNTTAPVITITGNNPATIIIGSTYADLGATAVDSQGHSLIVDTIDADKVDTTTAGEYIVTYTAFDGTNTSTSTRTVIVEADSLQSTVDSTTTEPTATTTDPVAEPIATTTEQI